MVVLNPPFQILQNWNRKFLTRFRRAKTADSEKDLELENAVVYHFDEKVAYWVKMPQKELLGIIDHRARYVAATDYSKPLGVGLTSIGVGMLGFFIGYLVGGLGLALLLFLVAAVSGAAVGLKVVTPRLARRPIWILAKDSRGIQGITHSTAAESVSPKAGQVTPSFIYEIMEARDFATFFRHGMTNWQKLAVGALVTLAIACLVALFLFVGAFGTGG